MKKAKIAVSYVLAVLLFCSAAISMMMSAAFFEMHRLPDMCESIVDDGYAENMSSAVQNRLKTTLALSVLTPEDISNVFDSESVRREAVAALKCTISDAYGTGAGDYSFESDTLRQRIEEKLQAYADENGLTYDESGAEETYTAVCAAVSAEFSVLSVKYTEKIAPAVVKLSKALSLFYIPVIVTAVLAAVIVILNLKSKFRAALTVLHPLYFAAFIPCVLFALLKHKDYLSNTVITEGTLSSLVQRVYMLVCKDVSLMTLIVTLIFAVALISTIVIMAAVTTKSPGGNDGGIISNDED